MLYVRWLEFQCALQLSKISHIHDIFTPEDYPEEWIFFGRKLWNEQYLLEAFLSCNKEFIVLGSTNYLLHHNYKEFTAVHPMTKFLSENGDKVGAGSFWLKKI